MGAPPPADDRLSCWLVYVDDPRQIAVALRPKAFPMTLASLLATQCLNALAVSALLFFISVGLTLIFGIMRIVNFAHGAIYMLGAYVGASVAHLTGSYWIALVAAPLLVAVLGLIAEPLALRPLNPPSTALRVSPPTLSSYPYPRLEMPSPIRPMPR